MAMAVTGLPGHHPTAGISDGCDLGSAEQLRGKAGSDPTSSGQGLSGEAQGRGPAGEHKVRHMVGNQFRASYSWSDTTDDLIQLLPNGILVMGAFLNGAKTLKGETLYLSELGGPRALAN